MTKTKRIGIATCFAVATLLTVPTVAGAADTGCYTGCTPPTVSPNSVPPPANHEPSNPPATTNSVNGSSSLPFTGPDVGEIAAVGLGAVVIGGMLTRRRHRTS